MLKKIKQNKALFFLVKCFFLYIIWFLGYEMWLHEKRFLDDFIIKNIVSTSNISLKIVGYATSEYNSANSLVRNIGIKDMPGLWIGDPCSGISVFALFAGFIIAFPGKIKTKIVFITLGLLIIHFSNILRVVALCILQYKNPAWLEFNHNYTFTIIVYSIVFFLWIIWVNKFSGITNKSKNEK